MKIELEKAELSATPDYVDGSSFYFNCWLSPSRNEIYDYNYIQAEIYYDCGETNSDFTDCYYSSSIFDLFEDNEEGLWFVSGYVESNYWSDYEGHCDHEFVVEVKTIQKCDNFSHLKQKWKELKGNKQ